MDQVAEGLGWSSAKVSRIETAYTLITVSDLNRLLEFYGLTGEPVERYVRLARAVRERGWWEIYSGTLNEKYAAFIGLEADAEAMSVYRVSIIDGLLQTPAYARVTVEADIPALPRREVDRLVQIRLKRQSRLRSFDPLKLLVVLDEGVLRRKIAEVAIMREQLAHLLEIGSLSNVDIRVIPFDSGYPRVLSDFNILKFREPEYPEVVYIEQMSGSLIIEDDNQVLTYSTVFHGICNKALDDGDSRKLITEIMREY